MINDDEIFLNSKFSLSDKIWIKPKKNIQKLATNFQQVFNLSYPLALLLAKQNVEFDQIENYLDPKIIIDDLVKIHLFFIENLNDIENKHFLFFNGSSENNKLLKTFSENAYQKCEKYFSERYVCNLFKDEILKNIISEQVLGMPQDMRADKGLPFNELPTGNK